MFSKRSPFGCTTKVNIAFVFPQLEGPTIKPLILLGSRSPCLFLICPLVLRSVFNTGRVMCCLMNFMIATERKWYKYSAFIASRSV